MWSYDEHWVSTVMGPLFASRYKQAGRTIGDDPQFVVWSSRTIYDITANGLSPEVSLAKHDAELCQALGITPPFPPAPSRDHVCGVRIGFQGVTIQTAQYGAIPAFGPETTTLSDADLTSYCQQVVALGYTHVEIAISWKYDEATYSYPVPGRDLTDDLPELHRRLVLMLSVPGIKAAMVFLAGDGRSKPKNPDGSYPYNDPQGHTYGHEWLMDNFPRIGAALFDLRQYLLFVPGYDGVFYGWGGDTDGIDRQPQRVIDFGRLFRQVLPDGYLALEHDIGHIPVGEGGGDYAGPLQSYDVILSEFDNWPATGGPTWQIGKRMLGAPHYTMPSDQAAVIARGPSDPQYAAAYDTYSDPGYLAPGTPRGPYFTCAYEFCTYDWVRGRLSAADVQKGRDYYRALGYEFTG